MIEAIKDFRLKLDAVYKKSNTIETSNEIENFRRCIIFAKAWLGKILQELGEPSPYKNDGKRKTIDDIEPTADRSQIDSPDIKGHESILDIKESDGGLSHIQKIDFYREKIKDFIIECSEIDNVAKNNTREFAIARTQAYTYLVEARFWLGFELERIKINN